MELDELISALEQTLGGRITKVEEEVATLQANFQDMNRDFENHKKGVLQQTTANCEAIQHEEQRNRNYSVKIFNLPVYMFLRW